MCSSDLFPSHDRRGYYVVVISNQSTIARGTAKGFNFHEMFMSYGCDLYEICPHDSSDNCNCRKPKNGMLYLICCKLGIEPDQCLVIGDRLSDVECALSLGASALMVSTGRGVSEYRKALSSGLSVSSIAIFSDTVSILPGFSK